MSHIEANNGYWGLDQIWQHHCGQMLTGGSQNEQQGQFQMLLDETKCQKIRILYLDYMDHAVLVYIIVITVKLKVLIRIFI